MDPWFEYSMSSKHMDKWKIRDKDERSAHAKMSIESLADPKMEEQKLQSVTAPVLSTSVLFRFSGSVGSTSGSVPVAMGCNENYI